MKIILFVDYTSKDFNKDFEISNVLLREHSILMVNSQEQLETAYPKYDLVILGNSCNNINCNYKNLINIKNLNMEEIICKINTFKN